MTETSTAAVLHAAALTFELDADKGVFHLSAPDGGRIASSLECSVRTNDGLFRSAGGRTIWRPLPEDEGEGLQAQFCTDQDLHLELLAHVDALVGGLTLTLTVSNRGPRRILSTAALLSTGELGALDFCPRFDGARFFRNGRQSWDPAATAQAGSPGVDPTQLVSHLVTALIPAKSDGGKDSEEGLVLGFTGAARQFGHIELRPHGESAGLTALVDGEQTVLEAGESFVSETLWLGYSEQPHLLLLDYARYCQPDRRPQPAPVAWDCWYSHFEDTSEKDVLEALAAAEKLQPAPDTFILSDGYQPIRFDGPSIGDWLDTNSRFPHGLAWMAKEIRKRGFRPGIWLAPFLVGEKSQFYKYYPNAVLRTRGEHQPDWWEMWRGERAYYLDPTHSDGRHFLQNLFETLSYTYGFEFFQVDFAYAGATDGFRKDAAATSAQALDSGLQVIRKTIGDDRYLLVAGGPVGAGAAWADAVQSGPETGPSWRGHCSALASLQAHLARAFLGAPAPALAPAPLLLTPEASGGLSDDEFKTVATAAGLTGGPITLSGSLEPLSGDRASVLASSIARWGQPTVALDLFDSATPQILGLPVRHRAGDWWIIGVFNTGDRPASRRLNFARLGWPTGAFHVYEFWQRQYLGEREESITLSDLPPHSCRVLAVHPRLGHPQFLSTNQNLLQGADTVRTVTWRPDETGKGGCLAVDLACPGRAAFHVHLLVPEGFLARSVNPRNARARINREISARPILSVEVSFRDQGGFDLVF
ncbi:MAG TPA: alpha-galactosidase [Armatimonadota bacterium]|nr:alpha-galactosidase [Armatimonadota bacterium]